MWTTTRIQAPRKYEHNWNVQTIPRLNSHKIWNFHRICTALCYKHKGSTCHNSHYKNVHFSLFQWRTPQFYFVDNKLLLSELFKLFFTTVLGIAPVGMKRPSEALAEHKRGSFYLSVWRFHKHAFVRPH